MKKSELVILGLSIVLTLVIVLPALFAEIN